MLPKPEVIQILSHATVFACPSIYEPLGIVNLEAMACETAVVATATGGIVEVVDDGVTGLLVPFEPATTPPASRATRRPSPPAFAEGLNAVVGDPARAAEMGRAGRARAVERFAWPAIAQETVALYQRAALSADAPTRLGSLDRPCPSSPTRSATTAWLPSASVDAPIAPVGGRYGRAFPELPALESDQAALLALGSAGGLCDGSDATGDDGTAAAGWPFFGQFIAHDITADRSPIGPHADATTIANFRSPRANLECLYGAGPGRRAVPLRRAPTPRSCWAATATCRATRRAPRCSATRATTSTSSSPSCTSASSARTTGSSTACARTASTRPSASPPRGGRRCGTTSG